MLASIAVTASLASACAVLPAVEGTIDDLLLLLPPSHPESAPSLLNLLVSERCERLLSFPGTAPDKITPRIKGGGKVIGQSKKKRKKGKKNRRKFILSLSSQTQLVSSSLRKRKETGAQGVKQQNQQQFTSDAPLFIVCSKEKVSFPLKLFFIFADMQNSYFSEWSFIIRLLCKLRSCDN